MKLAARVLTIVVAATGSSACVVSLGGFSCDVTVSRAATLDVGDATRVRVRARGGSDANLERVTLTATRVGTELVIETDAASGKGRLDLVVEVPDSLPLVVDDSSGGIEIYDVAAVELRDGSGGIDIDGVAGDVRIVDGSGGIEVSAVRGTVVIEDDGSGDIDITDVDGDVIVEEDGSGGIDVAEVGGDFVVMRDGSGGVRHMNVRGRVDLPAD